jgi:hypothetical protein
MFSFERRFAAMNHEELLKILVNGAFKSFRSFSVLATWPAGGDGRRRPSARAAGRAFARRDVATRHKVRSKLGTARKSDGAQLRASARSALQEGRGSGAALAGGGATRDDDEGKEQRKRRRREGKKGECQNGDVISLLGHRGPTPRGRGLGPGVVITLQKLHFSVTKGMNVATHAFNRRRLEDGNFPTNINDEWTTLRSLT